MGSCLRDYGHVISPAIYGCGLNVICLILPLQRVSITNNASGDILPVISGVPQGSILGSILFIIYRNTITTSMQFSQLSKFADDTKCFMSIASDIDCVKLQHGINALYNWSVQSLLKINPAKCFHVSLKPNLTSSYYISDTLVTTHTQKDLGITLLFR